MLPITFKSTKEEEEKEIDKRKRKREDNDKVKNRKVVNTKKIDDWLASDPKQYQEKFAGKNLKERPKLSGKSMCQRFHSKGYCFSDCFNKITHIPSQDLDKMSKKAYSAYCTLCRE